MIIRFSKILDFIYPRFCQFCSKKVDRLEGNLCSSCLMRVPFLPVNGCCAVCSRPVEGFSGSYVCDECLRDKPHFDKAVQAVSFSGSTRQMILDYKFKNKYYLSVDFALWLDAAARARLQVSEIDAVVAIPAKKDPSFERDYNHAELLAKHLSRLFDRKKVNGFIRIGNPKRQSSLSEKERRENVKNTFMVTKPSDIKGRTILLVDDIMTTGSTFSEASRILKAAGAWRVWALSIARSMRN